jgi:isocitrate dehydrogenase kinase/phosphatase
MSDRQPTIAITPTLFVGPNPPDVKGWFVHVTTYEEAAEILIERGMPKEAAWERIRDVTTAVANGDELFVAAPGQEDLFG